MKIYKQKIFKNSLKFLFFLRFIKRFKIVYSIIQKIKLLTIQRFENKRKKEEEKRYLEYKRSLIKKLKSTRINSCSDKNIYTSGKLRRVIV